MGKGETVLISEQCSEITPFKEDQVIPKGQVEYDVVSFNHVIPSNLREFIIVPSRKASFEKESNMGYIVKDTCMTTPPIAYSDEKTAFSDSSVSFVSAVKGQDRSFVVTHSDDLPNQAVCTQRIEKGVLIMAWKNERNNYLSSMKSLDDQVVLSYCQAHFRKCPGGRGNASGGGASYTYATSSDMQYSWVTGATGGSGSIFGGYSGGAGDDDDPWKQRRQIDMTPSHYIENFNILEDLDEMTADILRNDIFPDLGFGLDGLPSLDAVFNKDPSANVLMEDPSDPAPMTPAPTTPASYYVPSTPTHLPVVSSPAPTQAARSDIEDLLQINQMMRAPNTPLQKPQQSSTPGYLPAPNNLLGQTLLCTPTPASSEVHQPSQPISVPTQPAQPIIPLNFFDTTMYRDFAAKSLVINISVKKDSKDNHLAYQALQHCCSLYSKYQTGLQHPCNLPVAVQSKAKLCSMTVELSMSLRFAMPEDCVSLSEWMEKNSHSNDVRSRQLILQQIVNTLVILFEGPNDLCFWGSYQVFVASNKQVYLYIDFEKSLAIQKAYAVNGTMTNPRSEDCRLLAELYNSLLKPIVHKDMTWISPQLSQILLTFEQLTAVPSECVRQMAVVARVLGERRICKLQVELTLMQCTVYAVEHEPVSSSLQVLGKVVPVSIASLWAVLHANGSLVNMTEICAREGQNTFFLVPNPPNQPLMPGALYIGNC